LIYGLVRSANCTLFPLDERDVRDAGGACGFYFVAEEAVGPVVRRRWPRTVLVGLCVLALVGGAAVSLALSKPRDGAAAAVRDALRAEARQQDTVLVVEDQELAALREDPLVDAEVPVADVSAMVARLAQGGDLLIVAADEGPTALPPAIRKRSVTTRVIKTAAGAFCIWRLHGQPAG
jgi:hypothetical protein